MLLKKKKQQNKTNEVEESICVEQSKENMKKGKEPTCLIDFWMQEIVKELTACVYFICTIWLSELCTSESHVPLCACTSFALSGRRLSKNWTPATIVALFSSTSLNHRLPLSYSCPFFFLL